jgi:hypothetical protein
LLAAVIRRGECSIPDWHQGIGQFIGKCEKIGIDLLACPVRRAEARLIMQSADPCTVQAPSPWGFVLPANVVGISMSNLCV